MKLAVIALSFLLLSGPVGADASCVRDQLSVELYEHFGDLARDPCVYYPGGCHLNVVHLLKGLMASIPDFDVKEARILYLLSERSEKVRVLQGRNGPESWLFHVVMEYRGRIFDLDSPLGTQPQSTADYFKGVYVGHRHLPQVPKNHLQELRVRAIPAETYLEEFNTKSSGGPLIQWRYFASHGEAERRFPLQTAQSYLESGPAKGVPIRREFGNSPLRFEYDPASRDLVAIRIVDRDREYVLDVLTKELQIRENGVPLVEPEPVLRKLKEGFWLRLWSDAGDDLRLIMLLKKRGF